MKDRQVEQTLALQRIPFVSAFLHCVSMSVLVYLRSSFGYAYLRPKSIFMAGSWAFILFSIYAWYEPGVWSRFAFLCLFGLGAIALYHLHLIRAFRSEMRGDALHDNFAGVPHAPGILEKAKVNLPENFGLLWVVWGEPFLVLLFALVLRWPFGEKALSNWLLLVAPCFWAKEALNYWLQLRQKKRQRDAMDDADEGFRTVRPTEENEAASPSRKDKIKRQRVQ